MTATTDAPTLTPRRRQQAVRHRHRRADRRRPEPRTPGDFVSVVGPSGCGKSTLLRLASGLETATERQRRRHRRGHRATSSRTRRCWSGAPPPRNVELVQELRGVPQADRRAGPQEALDLVGLTGFEQQHPRAALRRHADAGLDRPRAGRRSRPRPLRRAVRRPRRDHPAADADRAAEALRCSSSFAGLFITHSVSEAVYLSTRVLVMSGRPGRIVDEIAGAVGLPARARACATPRVRRADRPGVPARWGSTHDDHPSRRRCPPTPPARQPGAAPDGAAAVVAHRARPDGADRARRRSASPRSGTWSATSCSRRRSASCCRRRTRRSASRCRNPNIAGPMFEALGRSIRVAIIGLGSRPCSASAGPR